MPEQESTTRPNLKEIFSYLQGNLKLNIKHCYDPGVEVQLLLTNPENNKTEVISQEWLSIRDLT